MDPFTLIAIAVVAALAGAAGSTAVSRRRSHRRELKEGIRMAIPCPPDPAVSLFDVFWDLGASDFALELMAHRGLLLSELDDIEKVIHSLPERISEHGDYAGFIKDSLEAIDEYYRAHRAAGNRRRLFALANPERLQLTAGDSNSPTEASTAVPYDRSAARQGEVDSPFVSRQDHGGVQERAAFDSEELDSDVMAMLAGLFSGKGAGVVKRWFSLRDARKLRSELDATFADLYAVYAEARSERPDFVAHLQATTWDEEALRIGALGKSKSWRRESWCDCAELLISEAQELATELGERVRENANAAIKRIDSLAKANNKPMAGYLLYLNRHAFFARDAQVADAAVRAIEVATHHLQQELRDKRHGS